MVQFGRMLSYREADELETPICGHTKTVYHIGSICGYFKNKWSGDPHYHIQI